MKITYKTNVLDVIRLVERSKRVYYVRIHYMDIVLGYKSAHMATVRVQ